MIEEPRITEEQKIDIIKFLEREYSYIYQNDEYTAYRMGYLKAISDIYEYMN